MRADGHIQNSNQYRGLERLSLSELKIAEALPPLIRALMGGAQSDNYNTIFAVLI